MKDEKIKTHFILGTAGHVDHGKTALIKALSGIDCDTHPEEKIRGITINLGFAHIDFPSGISIGIVDVPGHKDFINTMISGACGIDFVMLVIAADSGVMPQTLEHLHIMQMFGIKSGIVVVTKADLADEEMLMIVEEDINELLKNTFLQDCPVFKVSSKTGEGIGELRDYLSQLNLAGTGGSEDGAFRMFIDRIFSVSGFGTVVTGSVLSGSLKVEDKIYLQPGEKELRVKRLEKHGKEVQEVSAGNRAAINLSGLKKEEFRRGMVLCDRIINPTQMIDARIKIISNSKKINLWSNVIFLSGTYESQARVHLIDADNLKCGESALAQIHLDQLFIARAGDKFIIRNSSGDMTLGGGEIIDPHPLHHRRRTEKLVSQLKSISGGRLTEVIAAEVRKNRLPVTLECIVLNLNIPLSEITDFFAGTLPDDITYYNSQEDDTVYLMSSDLVNRVKQRIIKSIENYHKRNPLDEEGKTFEELMGVFGVNRNPSVEGFMKCLLDNMIKDDMLKKSADTWIVKTHTVKLTDEDKKHIKFVEVFHKNYAMNTPLMSELIPKAYKFGITEEKLNQIILYLVRQGRLYNIDNNYLCKDIVDNCRKILLEFLIDDNGITVAQFRDLVKGNRKICLLLLAQYDREGIIFRDGDLRFLTDKGRNWYKQRYEEFVTKSVF
ncbi:MAG: selenocysteine-specific translation elongation factor [Ignavibacteria bacterium GWC2_36_12]|nr:MAG: selenocysteine-specific translation elongation factor [Ignavibacteria bacterium GWC2_36_12]